MTAEMSVEIESSPDRSTCFSNDLGATGDPEVGDMVDSDFEAERLSNLEEEDQDLEEANEDGDSQSSGEMEAAAVFNIDRKRKMNRFAFISFEIIKK